MDIENSPETADRPLIAAVNESHQVEDDEFLNLQRTFSQHQNA